MLLMVFILFCHCPCVDSKQETILTTSSTDLAYAHDYPYSSCCCLLRWPEVRPRLRRMLESNNKGHVGIVWLLRAVEEQGHP